VLESFVAAYGANFEIRTARDAKEGLERALAEGPFAVVVSDMRMPGTDGLSFLKSIREMAPDTQRVMCTGHGDIGTALAAFNNGLVYRFLDKPCPRGVMLDTLVEACDIFDKATRRRSVSEISRAVVSGAYVRRRGHIDILAMIEDILRRLSGMADEKKLNVLTAFEGSSGASSFDLCMIGDGLLVPYLVESVLREAIEAALRASTLKIGVRVGEDVRVRAEFTPDPRVRRRSISRELAGEDADSGAAPDEGRLMRLALRELGGHMCARLGSGAPEHSWTALTLSIPSA